MNMRILSISSLLFVASTAHCNTPVNLDNLFKHQEALRQEAIATIEHRNMVEHNNLYIDMQQFRGIIGLNCDSNTDPSSEACQAVKKYDEVMDFLGKQNRKLAHDATNTKEAIASYNMSIIIAQELEKGSK